MRDEAEHVPPALDVKVPSLAPSLFKSPIEELERLGYTHVRIKCGDCGHNRLVSFFLLRSAASSRKVRRSWHSQARSGAASTGARCRRIWSVSSIKPS
jgi:hypothetical protein